MNETYSKHVAERAALGIPPLPLNADQARELCGRLAAGEAEAQLLELLRERIAPGVDPAAAVKAEFLTRLARRELKHPILTPAEAVRLLGTMLGGYNVPPLLALLDDGELGPAAARALSGMIHIFGNFPALKERLERGCKLARSVLEAWAGAEWFASRPELPERLDLIVFRVAGEINTDDFSPAREAPTRPDIPLHALCMGQKRFPGGVARFTEWRQAGRAVAFVGDTVGTGSSRKSAANSLIWHIGVDIPFVPNKRRGGVVLGAQIAPIFFNTLQDSGALPIRCEVGRLEDGQTISIFTREGRIESGSGRLLSAFALAPATLVDEYRAGGRVPLIIGRKLTAAAREALGQPAFMLFATPAAPAAKTGQGYSLAQKMVGRACGRTGVLPGETCEPTTSTVGSQDTTGPMTRDEVTELACLSYQADLVMQSFCHTAAYPTDKDRQTHATLPEFMTARGGVALKPGDGVIHSWLNRLLAPDELGTGGDSHTRFPLGVSFPAGSGLVAFAAALGCMPLDMPESVLVKFKGQLPAGLTLRDVVNGIALVAIESGLVDRPGQGTRNVFNNRILEMEGCPDLSVEQAFELTCASAERSAAAATIALNHEAVAAFVRSNVALIDSLLAAGYASAPTLKRRRDKLAQWLAKPSLLQRDANAEFAAVVEMDLADLTEPVVACPNNPDEVRRLNELAGRPIDEVFIGSCMTNIGHFRAAAAMLAGTEGLKVKRLWLTPPTRMDARRLETEGTLELFRKLGARVEIPGCSLCMGNQARVADAAVVFSTSTRNFDHRLGDGAQVYLGSAELAALTACLGRIPTPEEYFCAHARLIAPRQKEIYRYHDFSTSDGAAALKS